MKKLKLKKEYYSVHDSTTYFDPVRFFSYQDEIGNIEFTYLDDDSMIDVYNKKYLVEDANKSKLQNKLIAIEKILSFISDKLSTSFICVESDKFVSTDFKLIVYIRHIFYEYGGPYIRIITSYKPSPEELLIIDEITAELSLKEGGTSAVFNFISQTPSGLRLLTKDITKEIKIDVDNYYNTNHPVECLDSIIKMSEKSGLVLLSGIPGSGKSSLIKYLSQNNQNTKFCYLPSNNVSIFENPSFASFCFDNLKNSVIVIEDCEDLLKSRDLGHNPFIATLLNLTSGIVGDMLNIKVIVTVNTKDKIDSALLRTGRLLKHIEFDLLRKDQVENVAKSLGVELPEIKEMPLCDVFNISDVEVKEKIKIGF